MNSSARNGVQVSTHGQLPSGAEVALFTLTNARGHIVSASEYGCTLVDIVVPDSVGQLADVNLGYPGLAGYVSPGNPYFGCTIGRCANRIARGQFELDGVAHQLAKNDGPNHEHGGVRGFDKQLWTGRLVDGPVPKIRFALRSPEGQEGYPGNLDLCVELTWTDADALVLEYRATTDRATLVNLTNHCYFNLSGAPGSTVENHYLRLAADYYTVVDDALLPTGEIKSVIGTPLDFRRPRAIGAQLLAVGGSPRGYDHNFVIVGSNGSALRLAAEVVEMTSGRRLRVATTEPGLQFYTGNFLDGSQAGKRGVRYGRHSGFCLETQHFPDAIHHAHFPSVVLRPGQVFRSSTIYAFDVTDRPGW